MAKIHGKVSLIIAGNRYNSAPGATLKLSGDALTPVSGDQGFAGMQAAYEPGEVTCTIIASEDISTETLKNMREVALTFESDNGKSWISDSASRGPLPQLAKEGYAMTFYGDFKEA
jgi:hypothetical protein